MELGKHIKKLRSEKNLSQDDLSQLIFVSRQTISNWENDKSYPDVHSLVLLSKVLDVSVDKLLKGDIEKMKEKINQSDITRFKNISCILTVLFVLSIVTPIPLYHFWKNAGIAVWILIYLCTMAVALIAEKEKKKFDVQTYKEIVSFVEGKHLDEIDLIREKAKRPYQKILYAVSAGAITLIVSIIISKILGVF